MCFKITDRFASIVCIKRISYEALPLSYRAAPIIGDNGFGRTWANWAMAIRKPLCSGGEISAMNAWSAMCQRAGPPLKV